MHPTKFDKRLLMGLGLGLSFLFVVALLHDFGPEVHLLLHYHAADRPELIKLVRAHGAQDLIFFLLLIGLLNAVPGASNSLVCILVGLCYGPAIGLAVNWLGNVGGNVACFGLIKHLSFSKHFQQNRILTNLMQHKAPVSWVDLRLYDSHRAQCVGQLCLWPIKGVAATVFVDGRNWYAPHLRLVCFWGRCNYARRFKTPWRNRNFDRWVSGATPSFGVETASECQLK